MKKLTQGLKKTHEADSLRLAILIAQHDHLCKLPNTPMRSLNIAKLKLWAFVVSNRIEVVLQLQAS